LWRCLLTLLIALVLVAASVFGARLTWAQLVGRREFTFSSATLSFGQCPPFVRAEPMVQELRRGLTDTLGGASIFDEGLCDRMAQHLHARPWVRKVKSIRRLLPNTLHVQVLFRQPCALVEVAGLDYAVDRDGLWLPDRLYRRPAAWDDVRMPVVLDSVLEGPPPHDPSQGRPSLAVGARLTEFLFTEGILRELQIKSIDVTRVGRGGYEPDVTLETEGGVEIKWGCTDAYEQFEELSRPPEEPTDGEKLRMLRAAIERHPKFEGLQHIDLRYNKIFLLPSPPVGPEDRGPGSAAD